jgi:hypothetical protein
MIFTGEPVRARCSISWWTGRRGAVSMSGGSFSGYTEWLLGTTSTRCAHPRCARVAVRASSVVRQLSSSSSLSRNRPVCCASTSLLSFAMNRKPSRPSTTFPSAMTRMPDRAS